MQADESGMSVSATYYLNDPSALTAFEAEIRAKGLSDLYMVRTDEEAYEKVVSAIEGLKSISVTFMVIVLILGALILILLSAIAIRERKYEIGVLRAMGMEKHKVALGLWSEMIAITCLCLFLGLGVGVAVSQPVTNALLAGQVESANAAAEAAASAPKQISIGGFNTAADSVSALDELNVSLGIDTVLEIILISLLLASVAGITSISRITKYEPIKILVERN